MIARELPDAEALRGELDRLNEDGIGYMVAGMDRLGQPFVAFLVGVYAESVDVLVHNPWDPEVDVEGAPRDCDECRAQGPVRTSALNYPVTVLVAEVES